MTALAVFLTVWAFMAVSRGTPTGCFLHRLMVAMPAAALNGINRLHIVIAVTAIGLCAVLVWYGRGDGIRIAASTLPDAAIWLTTFEVSTYLDVVMMLVTASALTRFQHFRLFLANVRARPLPRLRSGRKHSRDYRQDQSHLSSVHDDQREPKSCIRKTDR
ncbi:hypothetical protein ABHV46_12535 [Asaia sp. BMEF1]|uniref:hypothetical protein n=1 Tax=Asaia sp. BMEF1 TaxID=3155932 RepID=UPI003F666796